MKRWGKILLSVLLAAAVAGGSVCLGVTFFGKNYKTADNTAFKILQITDTHVLNNPKKDDKMFKTISAMVETTAPDLIVVTGDVTSEKENMSAFRTFCTYMEGLNIPWAFTFGNHEGLDIPYEPGEILDSDKIADKQQLSEYLSSLENCIYERGDETVDGMGNYTYNVKDDSGNVLTTLIMMDSHSGYPDTTIGGYDCFHENQIEWYRHTVKSVAREVNGDESKTVPSLAFFHIPMREYADAYSAG